MSNLAHSDCTNPLSAALASVYTRSRGTAPQDVLANAAADLRLISTLLELDPNANVPDAVTRHLLEIVEVIESVAERLGGEPQ